MYSTGIYVQHPSTTPSITRQYCKHSLVSSLSHLLRLYSPVTVNKQKILEWSFKNSSAITACGCNYCLYGQGYSFYFIPSLCNRKCASFQAFCFITIGRKFPKFRVCLTKVPDFILRVTLKSWSGTDLHEPKFLKVLGSSLLHFPSLSICITLMCCMFSFPFSFSDSSYAKLSIPSHSPHYFFSFAHNFSVSPHAVSTAGLLPRYLCHPGQFLSFLSTPSECLKSSFLFISPLLSSRNLDETIPWFPMSPSFPLPILFFTVSPGSPSLCSAPSSVPLYALSSSWGLSLWRSPSHCPLPPHTTFSPLVRLLWLLPDLGSPSSSAPSLSPVLAHVLMGTNVAQDVRSECLPGGLLLCWSAGTHFPPWPRESLSEPTDTRQHRLRIYWERFVCNGSNPGGLREAASSKKHATFQY